MSRTSHPRRRVRHRDPLRHHIKDEHGAAHRYQNYNWSKRLGEGRKAKPAERASADCDEHGGRS